MQAALTHTVNTVFEPIIGFFRTTENPEKRLKKAVELIIGEKPANIELYTLAF